MLCFVLTGACGTTGPGSGGSSDGASATEFPSTGSTMETFANTDSDSTMETLATEPTSGTVASTGSANEELLAHCYAEQAAFGKHAEKSCTCLVEAGLYPDKRSCLADMPMSDSSCICLVLASDPENAQYLECAAIAEADLASCREPLSCTDPQGDSMCQDAYMAASSKCGALSKKSLGEMEVQCLSQPAFSCKSGEMIPQHYVCDLEPDCSDMSDELKDVCIFQCGSGEEVPKSFQCDGEPDCMDMSDEAMCS